MKVFVDYDSVLVDFTSPWLKWVMRNFHTTVTTQQMTHFDYVEERLGKEANEIWKTKGFYSLVNPLPEAPNFLSKLQEDYGKENVLIVTSSLPVTQPEKHEHIHRHFTIDDCNIIHTRVKHPHTSGGVLIDDNVKNCLGHSENNNAPSIVFDYKGTYGWSKFHNYQDIEYLNKHKHLLIHSQTYNEIHQILKVHRHGSRV